MIPLSPFNQRLTKSVQGDGAVAVITGCFCNPSHQSTAQHHRYKHMKGFLDFTPHHHQPQQVFIDCLLYARHFARCGKRKLQEKFPKDFEKGNMCPLEVSYLSLKWVTESFVKGDKRNSFYKEKWSKKKKRKEKWSRPMCIVRLLCVQFLPNVRKWCHHNYSTTWWPSGCGRSNLQHCTSTSFLSPDVLRHPCLLILPRPALPIPVGKMFLQSCPLLSHKMWRLDRNVLKKICTFEKGSVSPKSVRVKTNAIVSGRKKTELYEHKISVCLC